MIRDTITRGGRTARAIVLRGQRWARYHLPPGMRLVVGVLLMIGGIFAFLPVLGLWMLPLGFAIAAVDVAGFRLWLAARRAPKP
ncbi:hypothetical protein [Psychromarinibacter sp. S121]|uniref:hypothetical protein n=1 Tax=Psychromarinibacter sp. S121 TaxID=3415127 RepID=UPI003C7D067D